jgi:hypothetical protein
MPVLAAITANPDNEHLRAAARELFGDRRTPWPYAVAIRYFTYQCRQYESLEKD